PEPAPASNRTMSADEIAAAFAAAQQPAAAPEPAVQPAPEAAPEPAPASNRTMSADEIAAAQQPAAAPEPAVQPAPEAAPAPAPAAEPAPQPDTAADNPAPTKIMPHMVIPKSQISDNLTQDDYRFVNVMEQLILRQDIDNYLEQYNVCKCKRCVSDVCALALTGLPSKYVVSSKDSLPPILSYYESKFRIYMLTELIKACNKVRENPRHKK
ncbi:MAG: late competence development ComFB family protein, partial [Lachnospiraceae bacterium]|nr:late competence development ComFB family protein [Lachnospiraceae bacterium]